MPSWLSASASSLGQGAEGVLRRLLEVSRRAEIVTLLNSARSEAQVAQVTVEELGEALEAEVVFILVARSCGGPRTVLGRTGLSSEQASAVSQSGLCTAALQGLRAEVHDCGDLLTVDACSLLLSPWAADDGRRVLIGVARLYEERFEPSEIALLEAVTESVGHALERIWMGSERDRHAARQVALVRAAKALNGSLVNRDVLETLCRKISGAFAADVVAVYFADGSGALGAVAGRGIPDEALGGGQPDDSLAASVARTRASEVRHARPDDGDVDLGLRGLSGIRCGFAVPARRSAGVDGAIVVGFRAGRPIVEADVHLLTGFAELAGIAYRNVDEHAAVRRAATLDSLTGCLNHGAFFGRVIEETARAERSGRRLTLIAIDVDDFKSVNDRFGHPAGDALLRTLASVLREAVRSYDQVGRLGGDEFMVLLPAAEAGTARRVLDRLSAALLKARPEPGAAVMVSAGIADRRPGEDPDHLVDRADRALLEEKAARRTATGRGEPSRGPRSSSEGRGHPHEHQLAEAGALGTRLARLLDEREIVETAIADLHTHHPYERCSMVHRREDGAVEIVAAARPEANPTQTEVLLLDAATDGLEPPRASVRAVTRGLPVLVNDARADARLASGTGDTAVGSELAVPVFATGRLWGAIAVQSSAGDAFETDDVHLLQRVADHVGSALRTAELSRTLEQSYLGTAAALAATLEAKDFYTADHARSIADLAVRLGRAIGLAEAELRDLHYGALFHDIGKIAVPDAILHKPGALDEAEMGVVREHPLVGDRILAPVAFLSGIRRIVRHDHERWDGAGYPDGLRGDDIPLAARIVFVVDAFHAMTSDRPYRQAMSRGRARREVERNAGSQFDPGVVRVLLATLDSDEGLSVR